MNLNNPYREHDDKMVTYVKIEILYIADTS